VIFGLNCPRGYNYKQIQNYTDGNEESDWQVINVFVSQTIAVREHYSALVVVSSVLISLYFPVAEFAPK
jgi:hypothetical protein